MSERDSNTASETGKTTKLNKPYSEVPDRTEMATTSDGDKTVWEAIRHPLFIVFGLYCLVNGTAAKGMDVFMESLLKDRGFGKEMFFDSLMIGILSIVVFKFLIAWLCNIWSIGKVLALGMLLSSVVVGSVSLLNTPNDVYVWSLLKPLAWSVYVVVYFSIWSRSRVRFMSSRVPRPVLARCSSVSAGISWGRIFRSRMCSPSPSCSSVWRCCS